MLTELARQVALALHNVQLDAALQASLEELQQRNKELQHSWARIVAAGDAERRKLERNLHDGAQQHLVALAVKLRLARDAVEDDPADALAMIDEIKGDLQGAITELRSLAHGIFPPLLMSGGLGRGASRCGDTADRRHRSTCRASAAMAPTWRRAVYFCVLEALQNADKHAGESARVKVRVWEADRGSRLRGHRRRSRLRHHSGFGDGHGFLNMTDRLGAFGGVVTMRSQPGHGTTVTGTLPLAS